MAVFSNTQNHLLFRGCHIFTVIGAGRGKKWQKKTHFWPLFYHFFGPWKMSKKGVFCDFRPYSRKIIFFGTLLLSVGFWNVFKKNRWFFNLQIALLNLCRKIDPRWFCSCKKWPKIDDCSHFFFTFLSKISDFEQNP